MTIDFRDTGSIFDCGADAVVIPVNCMGVAGAGLALDAKRRWPVWHAYYTDECMLHDHQAGDVWVWESLGREGYPRFIFSAATKGHWRSKSTLDGVNRCLHHLAVGVRQVRPDAVAVPALGCGLGGLSWADTRPMFERILCDLPSRVIVFSPSTNP